VREVARGYECGITLDGFADFAEGDVLEAHVTEQQNI
jgi:translation initiation factor IF-2